MSVRLRFALLASSSLLLLFFFQLASAQTDPAACSVSCRFVIVPTLGPQGLPGLNGTRGDTGDTGQRGPEGPTGPQGPAGINGKDGINGTDGVDGQDATFDSSATYTGLKLEAPVLTGAINIDGAALTGSTSIDGAALTGTTTIGEGATILSPNITAPIIDGATVIGEGATLAKPKITSAELSGTTTFTPGTSLLNPVFTGLARSSLASIGPSVGTDCRGNTTGKKLTLELGTFGWNEIGSIVEWADGTTSTITDAVGGAPIGDIWGREGTVSDDTVRERMDCKLHRASSHLLSDGRLTSVPGPLVLHANGAANGAIITLSAASLPDRYRSTWSFPPPSPLAWGVTETDTFVGTDKAQTVSNKLISASTITSSVIKASETNGHIRMKNWGSLGISDPTDTGSPDYTMINVTITGSLVTANAEMFYPGHIGTVLEWSDGAAAVIQTAGPLGLLGSTNFTAARAFNTPRDWQMVKWWTANTMLSNNFAVFRDKIAMKALFGTAGAALTIDFTKMRVDAGVRHQTSWTFPHPGPAGQQNYFVGEESVQTLKNKKIDAIRAGAGVSASWLVGVGNVAFGPGSTALSGMIKMGTGGGYAANALLWTFKFPSMPQGTSKSFMVINPANTAAAKLTGVFVENMITIAHDTPTDTFNCYAANAIPDVGAVGWVYQITHA